MWVTIIVWLISYLLSYSKTKDAGKSALIATAAGAAAYYTIEPTNENAIWGEATGKFLGMDVPSGDEAVTGNAPTPNAGSGLSSLVGGTTQLGTTAIQGAADVAKSWGPAGTLGVVAGTSLSGSVDKKWFWIAAAAAAFILLK